MKLTKEDLEAYHELVTWYFWDDDGTEDTMCKRNRRIINNLTKKVRRERGE